jgi:preprotein translocase subunit SecF
MKLLRLAPESTNFPFMRFRRVSYPFSALLSLLSVALFLTMGMNFGIDFSGGTLLELRAKVGPADVAKLRSIAEQMKVGEVEVQGFGTETDVTLRFGLQDGGDAAQAAAVARVKQAIGEDYEIRRIEVVGPRVSSELVQSGTLGVVISIVAVLCYLWFRFEWQFAIGAIIATMHDLLLTVGFFSLTRLEFNTTSIAAILTIIGLSLNETVVVLDRIREMMRKYRKMPTDQLLDVSVNAVLPRTIMTATTNLLAVTALALLGGHVIRSFSLAMMWGIVVATYSSIFICSPMLIYLGLRSDTVGRAPSAGSNATEPSAPRA